MLDASPTTVRLKIEGVGGGGNNICFVDFVLYFKEGGGESSVDSCMVMSTTGG